MVLHPSVEQKENSVIISINAHPNSSKSSIEITDSTIEVYVNEPPDKGKANRAIMKLLSKQMKIQSSRMTLIKGLKARKKFILIEDTNIEDVLRKLS